MTKSITAGLLCIKIHNDRWGSFLDNKLTAIRTVDLRPRQLIMTFISHRWPPTKTSPTSKNTNSKLKKKENNKRKVTLAIGPTSVKYKRMKKTMAVRQNYLRGRSNLRTWKVYMGQLCKLTLQTPPKKWTCLIRTLRFYMWGRCTLTLELRVSCKKL